MRPLRLVAALLACLAVAVSAGCGGDESSGGVGAALSYVPADTPFAVAIDTDLEGDQWQALDGIVNRFPGAEQIKALLAAQLSMGQEGVDFEKDLRPLLGEPAVISATDVTSFLSDSGEAGFVAALQVSDTEALDALIEKTGAAEQGEVAGATVYQDEDTFFARDGEMVILAGSRELLESALQRADGGDSLSEDDFDSALDGLPDESLARVYVDVQALLGQSDGAAAARKIAWVGALRTLGLTIAAAEKSIDVEFNLRTEGGDLRDQDLPLAAGDEAAQVVKRPTEIGVGLRDPSQLVTFFESALQAVDPDTYGDYEQGKRAIEGRLDIDVQRDVIDQLTGNLSVSASIDGDFAARAELKDADAFAGTLDKLVEALPEFGVDGVTKAGDLYALRTGDGFELFFGVADGAFVLGSDAAGARAMAGGQPEDVEGAEGSLVVSADAEGIAREVLSQLAPQFGIPAPIVPVFARPFDELRGSVATSTDGMRGKLSLTLD
jgi:Protein of unknown function (DUF3352)